MQPCAASPGRPLPLPAADDPMISTVDYFALIADRCSASGPSNMRIERKVFGAETSL